MVTQRRDSKGRFVPCKIKQVKEWIKRNQDVFIVLFCIFVCITGLIWLFGDKVTLVCHEGDLVSINYSYGRYEYVHTSCAWQSEIHSGYTIPEAIGVEWGFITETTNGFTDWLLSHPVL